MYEVNVVVERPLSRVDAELVTGLHDEGAESVHIHVVVPEHAHARPVEAVLHDVAMSQGLIVPGDSPAPPDDEHHVEALDVLGETLRRLRAAGAHADGEIAAPGTTLEVLEERVGKGIVDEVVVMTRPHLVRETLHRDLASMCRKRLGVPVLRLFPHSGPT